jgi:flavorubredoxin
MNTKDFPRLQMDDIIEVYNDTEMRFFCNDEFGQHEDGRIQPDEDWEFKEEDVTRVWRQVEGEDYKCIYKREFYRGKNL